VVWAASNPEVAGKILDDMKNWSFDNLKYYYNWLVEFFISLCLVIAVYPNGAVLNWAVMALSLSSQISPDSR
jgi:choline-glycine betaine transporter